MVPVFLAFAFDRTTVSGFSASDDSRDSRLSTLRDQSRRVHAPLLAEHELANWLRAASSTSSFFAVDADARQAVRTAYDIEGGERCVTKSVWIVTHSCLPCSDRALHVAALSLGASARVANVSASSMVFLFELEAIIYMKCRRG
jgi:hypothetical protein